MGSTYGGSSSIGLIILAVVVLIVAGVGFALRSMAQARTASRCEANLMRIGEAMQMYTADNKGSLPFEDTDLKDGSKVSSWRDVLPNYLGDGELEKIGFCPGIKDEIDRMESYRFNSDLQGEGQPKSMWRKLNTLTIPEKTVLVFDGDVGGKNISIKGDKKDMAFRHREKSNVLFADFHVQPVAKEDRQWMIFEEDMEKGLK